MKLGLKHFSSKMTGSLISLALLTFGLAALGGVPGAAAISTPSNCISPAVPTGTLPTLSPFNLTVIGASGTTEKYN